MKFLKSRKTELMKLFEKPSVNEFFDKKDVPYITSPIQSSMCARSSSYLDISSLRSPTNNDKNIIHKIMFDCNPLFKQRIPSNKYLISKGVFRNSSEVESKRNYHPQA